uniref:t-SNARE coiled-coil homology domain-containing protein n=1 Tax=Chenopodium quinoa TaxID=63459 RepID=A0A803L647_CHEQI
MSFQDLEAGRRPLASRRDLINAKQDSTQSVASGIFQINTAVSSFQRLVNTLGTPKDTLQLREKLHKTRLHIGQLVKDTSAKLKQASETDHDSNISANKKIADAKLAKDFQAVLKEFQKAQRLAAERETAYTPFVPQAVLPSSYTASEVDVNSDKTPEQRALLVEARRQDVLLLDNEISFNEAVIEEREQGIQEIQQQIGEVNEIFKDLAVLVHDQGAMIDDIGSNVENAHAATAQARSHLGKASKTQRSNSSLDTSYQSASGDGLIYVSCAFIKSLNCSLVFSFSDDNYLSNADLLALGNLCDRSPNCSYSHCSIRRTECNISSLHELKRSLVWRDSKFPVSLPFLPHVALYVWLLEAGMQERLWDCVMLSIAGLGDCCDTFRSLGV